MNHYFMDFDPHLIRERNERVREEVRSVRLQEALRENGDQESKQNMKEDHLMRRAILLLAVMAATLLTYAGTALADTTIDTITIAQGNGNSWIGPFGAGVSDAETFGQVITVPTNDTQLREFTFLIDQTPNMTVRGEVYAWDGQKATGPNLYESQPRQTTGSGQLEEVTFHTGGIELNPGQKYVLFATVSKDYVANSGIHGSRWGWAFEDAYTGGNLVIMDSGSDFNKLFQNSWEVPFGGSFASSDLAFRAVFSTVVIDTIPPTLSLPADITEGATGSSGAQVSWQAPTATDDVNGSVPVGRDKNPGDTFPLGTTTVSCSATDAAGNTATGSFKVSVTYDWSGTLQPINADGSSIFKVGSTVPVKFALSGESAAIPDATAKLTFRKIDNRIEGSVAEATSTSAATQGNLFRYDATSGQYVYNWGTKGLEVGTYQLSIDLGDGTTNTVRVSLK